MVEVDAEFDVVDLFAGGAGGWHYALAPHAPRMVGLEIDLQAVATRVAAGHDVRPVDVTEVDPRDYPCRILTASPTCRPYSPGGKREGLQDREIVGDAIDDLAAGRDTRDTHRARCVNADSLLAAEPMRWIQVLRPETVLMEQVPGVLPLWQRYAGHLSAWGYSVWTGVVDAADYGAPQTRRRALLAASRVCETSAPSTRTGRHVSMAQALGVDQDWVLVSRRDSAARLAAHGPRRNRTAAEPAPTITGECWRWMWRHPDGRTEPLTPAQAGVLQGFPVGHPWQGPKTRVALQIGNAIPPQLAEAAYSAATGAGELILPLAA
ncbi:DNA cytosine methyltransferase [Streptomyces alfalfae]